MRRPRYEHRQVSWAAWLAGLAVLMGLAVAWTQDDAFPPALWLAAPLVLGMVAAFGSLTIAIDHECLRWHFGPGVWRKRLLLEEIAEVTITRTRAWEGWGIRWTPRGWLYNVAGLDAVLVRRRDGKAVLLGSDEAGRLAAALERAVARRRRGG